MATGTGIEIGLGIEKKDRNKNRNRDRNRDRNRREQNIDRSLSNMICLSREESRIFLNYEHAESRIHVLDALKGGEGKGVTILLYRGRAKTRDLNTLLKYRQLRICTGQDRISSDTRYAFLLPALFITQTSKR